MNVNRYYICDSCDFSFCIKQEINQKLRKKCPSCGKHKLYQDLTEQHVYCHNITTLGQLGRQNWKKMGTYEKQDRVLADKQEAINRKFKPAVERGYITPDKVPSAEFKPAFDPLSKEVKKKLFSGDKKERKQKIDNYIKKGIC